MSDLIKFVTLPLKVKNTETVQKHFPRERRQNSCLASVGVVSHDRVRFSTASLSVRKYGAVVAKPGVLQHCETKVIEYLCLPVSSQSKKTSRSFGFKRHQDHPPNQDDWEENYLHFF